MSFLDWFRKDVEEERIMVNAEESKEIIEDTTSDEEEDTYTMELECNNCDDVTEYDIPCGKTVKDWAVDKKCDTCECVGYLSKRKEEEDE